MAVLVAVRTVHEAAAVCDRLADRDGVERVVGIGVAPPDDSDAARDAGEALNVLAVRLPGNDVTTEQRTGDPSDVVSGAVEDHGATAVLVAGGFDGLDDLRDALEVTVTVVADPADAHREG